MSRHELRAWCATGRLRCEKDSHVWTVPIAELPRVGELAEEREAAIATGHAEALVVPVASASPDLASEVARRLGLPGGMVTTSTLSLDGAEYVLAVWKMERAAGPDELAPLVELADELGGELLDGEVKQDRAS
jgi:hypothetical protein